MLPDEQKLYDVEMKIGLLGKDVEQTDKLCSKLSESIEKLQEVNSNILRMITIHEQRHEQHEKVEEDLKEDIKELHSRITTVNRELQERIDQVELRIGDKIDGLREALAQHAKNDPNRIVTTLAEIDKYKYLILGGAIVAGWIVGHLDLVALGKLLK